MPHTYGDSKHIYSVDMMHAYINIRRPVPIALSVESVKKNLTEIKGWRDNVTGESYSAADVLANPDRYPDDHRRIMTANFNYSIIVTPVGDELELVDGAHRVAKAHILGYKTINAYVFTRELMSKFIVGDAGEQGRVDRMPISEFIQLYTQRL